MALHRLPVSRCLLLAAMAVAVIALAPLAPTAQAQGRFAPEIQELVDEIATHAEDPFKQDKRAAALKKLVRMNSAEVVPAILPVLADPFTHLVEKTRLYLSGARYYGGGLRSADAIEALIKKGLKDRNETVRLQVAIVLGRMADNDEVKSRADLIVSIVNRERSEAVRLQTVETLGLLGVETEDVVEFLIKEAKRGKAQATASIALARLGRFDAIEKPDNLLKDRDAPVRIGIIDACAIAGTMLPEAIEAALGRREREDSVRIAGVEACVALHAIDPAKAVELLAQASEDDSWRVRSAVVDVVVTIWANDVVHLLVDRLEKEEGRLSLDAWLRLRAMTGKEFGFDAGQWRTWWNAQKDKFDLQKKPTDKWGPQLADPDTGAPSGGGNATAAFFQIPIMSTRPMFVFDPSGSMRNEAGDGSGMTKIEYACDNCLEALSAMPEESKFNILLWRYWSEFPPRTEAEWAFPRMVPVGRRTLDDARKFVNAIAARGWGDFYGALQNAFADPEVDTIFFLSDGGASRGDFVQDDELLKAIRKLNRFRRVTVHTVLTGDTGTDAKFMQNLANLTGGIFRQVDPAND